MKNIIFTAALAIIAGVCFSQNNLVSNKNFTQVASGDTIQHKITGSQNKLWSNEDLYIYNNSGKKTILNNQVNLNYKSVGTSDSVLVREGNILKYKLLSGVLGNYWSVAGNSITTGVKSLGTINNRSFNVITNNINRARFDSTGYFAHMSTSNSDTRGFLLYQNNAGDEGINIGAFKSRGTYSSPSVITSGDTIFSIRGWGYDGTASRYVKSGTINIISSGIVGGASGRIPSKITFSTGTNANPTVVTEAFSINSGQTGTFNKNLFVNGSTHLGNATSDTLFFQAADTITDIITLPSAVGNLANYNATMDTLFCEAVSDGLMYSVNITYTLADDATLAFVTGKTVAFDIFVKGGDERAIGTVKTDGTVTIGLGFGTIVWDDADTDGDYCIYDGGTGGILKNRSGSGKTFFINLKYNRN